METLLLVIFAAFLIFLISKAGHKSEDLFLQDAGHAVGARRLNGVRYAYFRNSKNKISAKVEAKNFEHFIAGDCESIIQMRASCEPMPPLAHAARIADQRWREHERGKNEDNND